MRTWLLAACLAAVTTPALADTVWLKNGGKLEGVTTSVEGERLVVRTQAGTVKFNREDVLKVVHKATAMEEYELAAAKVKPGDARGHYELADWCAARDLKRFERVELEATIAADPEHIGARSRLGYEKVGKNWLRGEELLVARGMVKVDGKWMTKEAAAAVAAEKERIRLDRALAAAEAKAAREAKETEGDRLREFYESQDRVRRYLDRRGDDFDGRRSPRPYPGGYRDWYSDPWSGGYYQVGVIGYPWYGYSRYPRYGYGGYSAGIRYSSGRYSFSFGTSHYGYGSSYGYGHRRYSGGSYSSPYYGPVGGYVPGGSPYNPGYYNSSGSFDRGGNPHYGGAR
ncbi:MAG: hypothetical protein HUU15_10225 [Candidatus Brocadiae bacterium]|nr:hypothetical protein [Candidatus Brocadiia bacterium]